MVELILMAIIAQYSPVQFPELNVFEALEAVSSTLSCEQSILREYLDIECGTRKIRRIYTRVSSDWRDCSTTTVIA